MLGALVGCNDGRATGFLLGLLVDETDVTWFGWLNGCSLGWLVGSDNVGTRVVGLDVETRTCDGALVGFTGGLIGALLGREACNWR